MATRYIHIVGAGMAGLSAALQLSLAGEKVVLYDAAPFAGGRCRSFIDRELGCVIDNGNHLVLSGNAAIHDYLFLTGALETIGLHLGRRANRRILKEHGTERTSERIAELLQ